MDTLGNLNILLWYQVFHDMNLHIGHGWPLRTIAGPQALMQDDYKRNTNLSMQKIKTK